MKLKESGLPASVIENTPKYLRRTKIPVVKAKIGPRNHDTYVREQSIRSPAGQEEVKAVVSGLYITEIKSVRGGLSNRRRKRKDSLSGKLALFRVFRRRSVPGLDIITQNPFRSTSKI